MNNAPYLDVDFIRDNFNKTILDDYQHALDFISEQPDFSLLKFRKIIESLCDIIIKHKRIEIIKGLSLQEKIDELDQQQMLFQGNSKRTLHQARMLCNFGVHSPKNQTQCNTSEEVQKAKETIEKEKLGKEKTKAKEARELIIQIFEDTYLVLNKDKKIPKLSRAPTGKQTYKELLFKVTTPSCSDKELLEAGNIYETLSKKYPFPDSRLEQDYYPLKQNFLYNLAANCYKTSYKMSVDMYEFKYYKGQINQDDHILQKCQLEPLFKYASLASKGLLGESYKEEGWRLMKKTIERKYIKALVPYGKHCCDKQPDSLEAKQYFIMATEHDEPLAYSELSRYYKTNNINKDEILALLEKGRKLDDSDSIYQLGLMYQKGYIVEKNKEKSEELFREAEDSGSLEASYELPEFKKGLQAFTKYMTEAISVLAHVTNKKDTTQRYTHTPIKRKEKIGRNDPCSCGSGKKYKQCCLDTKK